MAYHAVSSSGIYTDACKDWCRNQSAEKTWANFKIFFTLWYNELREGKYLNATQAGLYNYNHAAEEQQYFASSLDNLAIVDLSDKDVIAQLISSNKTFTESNNTLTATIASLIHHGTGNREQTTQTSEEKAKIRKVNMFQGYI